MRLASTATGSCGTGLTTSRGGRDKLSIACNADRCFIAGTSGQGYAFEGGRFAPIAVSSDSTVKIQAFTREQSGTIIALFSPAHGKSVTIARYNGKTFDEAGKVEVPLPEAARVRVRFARQQVGGKLWIGLAYVDAEGEQRPWGVMTVEGGKAIAHRSTLLPSEDRGAGSLALPDDIRDVYFRGDDVWLATDSGVCRVRGTNVTLFTENEGLGSELSYAVADAEGAVYVATYGGVGHYDGKAWRFDLGGALARESRSIIAAGRVLWVGTEAGLVRREGKSMRVLGVKDGLAGDKVRDLHLDSQSRLWVLTDRGLSILKL